MSVIARQALIDALGVMATLTQNEGESTEDFSLRMREALADAIVAYAAAGTVTTASFGTPTPVVTP